MREGWRNDAMRCVTIRYEKLWLSFVMGSCFVVVVLFFLFFCLRTGSSCSHNASFSAPVKTRMSQSVSWWAEGDCAGLEHSSVQPSFHEGLDSGVRCTAFNLQAVLYSLPLLVLLSCVCVPVCLSFFDFTSSRHTHSLTHTTLNHALYASGHRVASACCIFFILGLFIYLFIFAFFAYTKKTSKNSHRFCMHFTRCFLCSALLAARDR